MCVCVCVCVCVCFLYTEFFLFHCFRLSLRLEPTEATRQKEAETMVTSDPLPPLHPLRVTKSQEDLLTPGVEIIEPPKFSTPRAQKLKSNDRSHSSLGIEGSSPCTSKKSITLPRLEHKHSSSSGALISMEPPPPLPMLVESPEKKRLLGSPWRGHQKSRSVGTK